MHTLDKKIKELQTEQNRRLIQKALCLDDGQYSQIIFNTGMAWIERNMGLNDDTICNVIGACPRFWLWWRVQWALRDRVFINDTSLRTHELPFTGSTLQALRELYDDAHDISNMKGIRLDREAINEVGAALRAFSKRETEKLKQLIHGK